MRKLITLLSITLFMLGVVNKSFATTCAEAAPIPALPTFPWVSDLTCGTTDDINSGNATPCGSASYLGGLEAVYVWTPGGSYADVTFAYVGQTWSGLFLYEGCPTEITSICIANVTSTTGSKTLAYEGTNQTSGTPISLNEGVTYYLVIDTWPAPPSPCPGTITINGTLLFPCSGIPDPGNTLASANPAGSGVNFTLSLENFTPGTGVNYQWQDSDNGSDWNNVGPNAPTFETSQTVATWYHCIVTCTHSAESGISTPVYVTMAGGLSGSYTINSTLPTGGTNFESFTDFATAMNLGGFAGPVVVDVVTGTGPYNEQVMLGELPNSSAVNTLTINGNGEILEFLSTNTNERATLKFDGTDYVTVNNLIVKALGSVTGEFGWALWLANGADYNTFQNCEFHADKTSTLANFAGFVTSNSATGATTAGLAASNLTVTGCKVIGGSWGLIVNGPTSAPFSENNVITDNEITDFRLYGLYLRGQNNSLFSDNLISRPTREHTGILYMLYVTQNMSGSEIINNQIFDISPAITNTSTAHGIYGTTISAEVGQEVLFANNVIYGWENLNAAQYGIYLLTTDNARVYHNTVSMDHTGHPGATSIIRSFHHSGNLATIDIRNNIFSVTSNSGGVKYCMYFAQTLANIPVLTSDHNVLHMGATAGTNHTVFWNGGGGPSFTTLADWQVAGGGIYDQNSVDADPTFFTPLLTPLNPAVDNIGTDLLAFVPEDIFGVARTATPDPGAIEFDPPSCFPPTVPVVSNVTHITVTLSWNAGSNETLWNVKYGPPGFDPDIEGTLITGITTTTYLLEGLDENTSYDVYVQADCTARSLSSWAGPAQFTTMYANDLAIVEIVSPASNVCYEGSEVVSILITNLGGATVDVPFDASYQIDAGTPVTENVNLVIAPGDTVSYTFTTPITVVITEEFIFDLAVSVDLASDLNPANDEMVMEVTFSIIPDPPTGIDGNTTAGNTATLEAISTYDVNWYASDDPGDMNVLYTGAVFTTPVLYTSTPFYAAAAEIAQEDAGKPAPTSTSNTSGQNWGLVFDVVNSAIVLNSVDVYSVGAGGGMEVELRDNAGTLIETLGPFTYPSGTTSDPSIVTFNLNLSVPVGTGYRLIGVSMTGNLIREFSAENNYPYTSPSGNVVVTSGFITNPGSTTYYWFYNWNVTASGCESERSEVWANMPEGAVGGNVSQASRSVIEGARVFSDPGDFEAFTNEFGNYLIENVGAGTYDFYCEAEGYFTAVAENIVILENETTTLNFELDYAEIAVDPGSFEEELQAGQSTTKQLTISNPGGTGTLTWNASVSLPVGGAKGALFTYPEEQGNNALSGDVDTNPDPQHYFPDLSRNAFDLYGYFPTGAPSPTSEYSVVTDGQFIYTASWNANLFNKYDMSGTYIEQFSITGAGNVRDLTYDGQYFYGSANNNVIFEMDFSTQTLVSSITAPVGNQIRGIAYDPVNNGFWVTGGSFSGPFRLINRAGDVVQELATTVGNMSGLAYDNVTPGGPYLWAYTPSLGTGAHVLVKVDMITGNPLQSVDIATTGIFGPESTSGGLNITNLVVPGVWTFLGIAQNDAVWLMELSGWLTLDPTSGTVAPGGNNVVDVNFNAAGLSVGTYQLSIQITHDGQEVNRGTLSVPVTLNVIAASCPAPTNLYANNIALTEADLGWTSGGTEILWNVEVGLPGFTPGNLQEVQAIYGTTDNPLQVKSLNHSTAYEFYVQADCDELGETSPWAGPFAFATLELCPKPTDLTAINITASSADLGWTPGGVETTWNIEWGETGFTQGAGTLIPDVINNPYTLSGLNPHTGYDFYVQANCGGGELSNWAGPFSFMTACGTFALPFFEDFEEDMFPPLCWERYDLDGVGTQWVSSTAQNHTPAGTRSALHAWSTAAPLPDGQDGWFVTPALVLPDDSFISLSFWSYNDFPTFYTKNSVLVSTGSSDPTDSDFVEVWTTSSVSASWVETIVSLNAYSGQTIYVAFRYQGYDGHNWFLDDMLIDIEAPTVPENRNIDNEANLDGCFDATNTITVTNSTVPNGSSAYFKAGVNIIFGVGFVVESGGYMHAEITNDYCVLPLALVATDDVIVPEEIPAIPVQESFFKVFPNPTTSTFKLELLGADEAARINVEIYGMMGERVFQDVLFGAMIYEFDLSNMPKGIYFIRVLMGDEMGIEKVIKH